MITNNDNITFPFYKISKKQIQALIKLLYDYT